MPEYPENIAFCRTIQKALVDEAWKMKRPALGHLEIFLVTFTTGTTTKLYTTFTVDSKEFGSSTQHSVPLDQLNTHTAKRLKESKYTACQYLMATEKVKGPVLINTWGKYMFIAAGHGLEGHPIVMNISDFHEMTVESVSGPNPNKMKAEKLWQFPLPEWFVEPHL
ncbi:hypothetical protein FISHEDRAFT_59859 [Fistulina hepatica ATCC 64428]|uniref:Uncharacterized protein n=1 Tax=Fistulina hepatica ATCC 64428 TaxID=1128425 RepID=A0A0D7A9N9_9AGAR|nr:hypothetical protein FISHEDRAFT_59859 [Fistulina hepatica ATCC 64428]